jgi:hypothetical protein
MAETASSVITDALQEILVQASEQPIESSEMKTGIRYLNRMMASLDANGISLGYTVVSNPSDTITVPDGAIEGIVYNLAIRLAQQFDEPISPTLAASARTGLSAMRKITVVPLPTAYPGTLPVGSGNEGDGTHVDHFYPTTPDSVLTEDNGNILLESDT